MKKLYACIFLIFTSCADLEKFKGPQGEKGDKGDSGDTCSVSQSVNGALILCPDGTSVMILNGTNGVNGVNGADGQAAPAGPYNIIELIDPCGKQGRFDELLLRLENKQLVAHYSHGVNQFLTTIGPGSYKTTDGTECYFYINNDLEVLW